MEIENNMLIHSEPKQEYVRQNYFLFVFLKAWFILYTLVPIIFLTCIPFRGNIDFYLLVSIKQDSVSCFKLSSNIRQFHTKFP